jgi:NADH-quinone oxidoreductase subunit H
MTIIFSIIVFAMVLIVGFHVAPLMTWVERRQCAFIQRRVGPNRVGIFGFTLFGLGQPIADAVKLLFKEDGNPSYVQPFFYFIAPLIPPVTGLAALMVIPFGAQDTFFGTVFSPQVLNVGAGFLLFFAMSSMSVYGVTLAGWSSNNKYSLLGGLRASAQMISYELGMGLSLIPIVLIYQTLDLQQIVYAQSHSYLFGFLPDWGIFRAPVSFFIFLITIFAETNRLPFDLAEGEAELIAGFLVEYGGMRWSLFFLGEYAMMFAFSGLISCLFLGGYSLPYLTHESLIHIVQPIFGSFGSIAVFLMEFATLIVKMSIIMLIFVQVRFTVPRFRYDQLMKLGWVTILPLALINLFVTALVLGYSSFK